LHLQKPLHEIGEEVDVCVADGEEEWYGQVVLFGGQSLRMLDSNATHTQQDGV